jgi:hypothetical protein
MGFKKLYPPNSIITAGVMTGTASLGSTVIPILNGDNFSVQVRWTGTPTGTINFCLSNDQINYDNLVFSPAIIQPIGTAGGFTANMTFLATGWFQMQYTNISGTGSLTAILVGKDLN